MKKVLCLTTVFFVCFLSVTIFCVMQRKSNVELTQECKQYLKDQGVENYKIKKTGNIVLTGETKHCFTDMNLRPVRLQKQIPDFYEKFMTMET